MSAPVQPAKVLVVDDDAGLLRLMQKALQREHLEVAAAPSAALALERFAESAFALVLVDLKLPDCSGQQLIQKILERSPSQPFAVITGQGDERVAVELMKQGAVDYLVKDREFLETMPTRVRRAVEQISQQRRLQEAEMALQRLQAEILEISGREQRRIGQDLHDGLGQHLTGIELMSQALEQALKKKKRPEAEDAAKIARHVREAIVQAKSLSRGLVPVELERNGLMSALQELCRGISDFSRVDCLFVCGKPVPIEDNKTATHLYRIAQEAVNNAVKHGRPGRIEIELRSENGAVTLRIANNGTGIPSTPRAGGMGLDIMRYRARTIGANLEIRARPESGTAVECILPKVE